MNFHETIMGKRFFESQLPQLIQALRDIAARQPQPVAVIDLAGEPEAPDLLKTLYQQSAVFEHTETLHQYNLAAIKAQKGFLPYLSAESRTAFDEYQQIVENRCGDLSELAYRTGFETAVQLILAGLLMPRKEQADD